MIIVARQSFWIKKPFNNAVMDAFARFTTQGYVEKLKANITPISVPPTTDQDIITSRLYNLIIQISS